MPFYISRWIETGPLFSIIFTHQKKAVQGIFEIFKLVYCCQCFVVTDVIAMCCFAAQH